MFNVKGLFLVNKELMIKQFPEIALLKDEALLNYTYTKTGGPADILAFPKSAKEVEQIVAYCRETDTPWLVLGNASNLIVRDGGIRGVVIMLSEMNQITVEDTTLIVEAGAKLIDTTYVALHESLTGFEFACGIPGSVGGAVFMNAGAYKSDMAGIVQEAYVLKEHTICIMRKDELDYAYRHSIFQQHRDWLILGCRLQLQEGDQKEIRDVMDSRRKRRMDSQPLNKPCAGSVFRNPESHQAWQLIESIGMRGKRIGGAMVSEKHASCFTMMSKRNTWLCKIKRKNVKSGAENGDL